MTTFSIPESKNDIFIEKMNKFSKRAAKLGISFGYALTETTTESYRIEDKFAVWHTVYYPCYHYDVWGEAPVINGYSFLAKVEPLEANKNLIHSYNSEYDFSAYRSANLVCEHCHQNRNRNFYYLISNDADGSVKMVGRNCLANYIGQPDAEEVAEFYAGLLSDLDWWSQVMDAMKDSSEFENSFRSGCAMLDIETVLTYTVYSVNKRGYISKGYAQTTGDLSTSYHVLDMIYSREDYTSTDKKIAFTGEEKNVAINILEVVTKELSSKSSLNEYEYTVLSLIESKMIKRSHVGYACSIISLYNRIMENNTASAKSTSEFLGEVDSKIFDVSAVVTLHSKMANDFRGTTHLYHFDADGNKVVYFSSNDLGVEVGNQVIITKATIKKHDTYKGIKQTVITRGKVEVVSN